MCKMLECRLLVLEEDGVEGFMFMVMCANAISYKIQQNCQQINLFIYLRYVFSVLGCICKVKKINSAPEVSYNRRGMNIGER